MPAIGVTGGVASGKSLLTELLASALDCKTFSADRFVDELYREDDVRREIASLFGSKVIDSSGNVDRKLVRDIIFKDSQLKLALEKILHPKVRSRWRAEASKADEKTIVLIEIPLLFETGAEKDLDKTICVACSRKTQLHRLLQDRRLDKNIAGKIIESQMPWQEKLGRADYILWNDGPVNAMKIQADILASTLNQRRYD